MSPVLWVLLQLAASPPPDSIPYRPGLQVTWSTSISGEPDYEAIVAVQSVEGDAAVLRLSWNRGSDRRWKEIQRPLSRRERQLGRSFYHYAEEGGANDFRGYALGMTTQAVLDRLKGEGRAEIAFILPEVARTPHRGTLTRVGREVAFPLLVDGKRVSVSGVHAAGTLRNPTSPVPEVDADFVFLDDAQAAWMLDSRLTYPGGEGRRLLVRIETGAVTGDLERELRGRCRGTIHDLYFATASVDMDAASRPALERLASILAANPDWRLTLVGHTDSIGTAESNLELSRRRAERVREVLGTEHGIALSRLSAEGRGETEPIEDDGTPEGRARNRRVDLMRACG